VRALALPLLLAAAATAADAPSADATGGEEACLRAGLGSRARGVRDEAEAAARARARLDPKSVEALLPALGHRARCALLRALAAAGTAHAAGLALAHGADPDREVFAAILEGLVHGGERALFAEPPAPLPPARAAALAAVRMRWRVEAEIAKLKSPTGPTGHYVGQFDDVKALGPEALPALFAILTDAELPAPGEAGAGRYAPIHPDMERFDSQELRELVANGLGSVIDSQDLESRRKLRALFDLYWYGYAGEALREFEHESLAPALAFSLHDLGETEPAEAYLDSLRPRRGLRSHDEMQRRWRYAYALVRIGRHAEGEREYQRLLDDEASDRRDLTAYNLACALSMRAMQEPRRREYYRARALDYLERAEQLGYTEWPWMEQDRDLDAIRDHPRYKGVLERLKARFPGRPLRKPR
jgi:hypothetical protein